MFDSQVVIAKGTDYSLYGPWMSRGGDFLQATLNFVGIGAAPTPAPTLTVELLTKNSEDSGGGDLAGALTFVGSAVGVASGAWRSGAGGGGTSNATLDELVRYLQKGQRRWRCVRKWGGYGFAVFLR